MDPWYKSLYQCSKNQIMESRISRLRQPVMKVGCVLQRCVQGPDKVGDGEKELGRAPLSH